MVREVLDRESKKKVPESVELANVEVTEVIERIISMNKAKAMLKDIDLKYNIEPEDLRANLDQNKIEIAVNNLVSNALKFTPARGTVSVSVSQIDESESILFEINDTGIGIPKGMKDDLFDSEIQYSRMGTGGEAGTGLGLDIVHLYVSMHSGEIWVESEENIGTTFFIKLPVDPNIE
jgi:signal transduction histidine kinase